MCYDIVNTVQIYLMWFRSQTMVQNEDPNQVQRHGGSKSLILRAFLVRNSHLISTELVVCWLCVKEMYCNDVTVNG